VRRAQELDPLTLTVSHALGMVFYSMRQHDRAIEEFRKVLDVEPNFPLTSFGLARAYEAKGMYAEAIAEFQRAVGLFEREPFALHGLGPHTAEEKDRTGSLPASSSTAAATLHRR